MKFFNETIKFRIRKEEKNNINKIILKKKDKYENLSHFIRCSIIKEIKNNE